jgi:hypothetical protein
MVVPHLTPTLPPRYRRLALAALAGLTTRARDDVAHHHAEIERLTLVGKETTSAEAGLSLAERGLGLLRGRQHFLRSSGPPLEEL